jgi:pimeloyl-ACP methyl ester carboxylesterase
MQVKIQKRGETMLSKTMLLLAGALWMPAMLLAQEEPQVWLGELDVQVAKLRLEVRLTTDDEGATKAQLISLDQNNAEIPVDSFVLEAGSVTMKMPSVQASFKGTMNEDSTECSGTFTQLGKEYPLTFRKVDRVPDRTHVKTWAGILKAGAREFEFQLRVFEDDDGQKSAVLDSFTESIEGLSTNFQQEGNSFQFEVPLSAGKYEGTLNEDQTKVIGKWIQGGGEYDLEFDSVEVSETRKLTMKRPQTPKAPFPYEVVELAIENETADLMLSGTLTIPEGDGPFSLAVLVSGSGPQDRDETIMGHKPFAVLADHLTRAGVAVFRFDDRGVGESTGDFAAATSEDFASDVIAIVNQLRERDDIRGDRVGVIGHSEGGLIAPMVAVKDPKLHFIVLMAGPGVSGREILLKQSREISQVSGASKEALDLNEKILMMVLDKISLDTKSENVIDEAIEEFKASLSEDDRESFALPESVKSQFKQFESPWFRFFNAYDPAPTVAQVRCSVLSVIGEKDLQVDCEVNSKAIRAALEQGGNADFRIEKLPELNHLFQKCETGSPGEYSKIEETLNRAFLELVTEWVLEKSR